MPFVSWSGAIYSIYTVVDFSVGFAKVGIGSYVMRKLVWDHCIWSDPSIISSDYNGKLSWFVEDDDARLKQYGGTSVGM